MLIILDHAKERFNPANRRCAPVILHAVLNLQVGDHLHLGRINGHTLTIYDMTLSCLYNGCLYKKVFKAGTCVAAL